MSGENTIAIKDRDALRGNITTMKGQQATIQELGTKNKAAFDQVCAAITALGGEAPTDAGANLESDAQAASSSYGDAAASLQTWMDTLTVIDAGGAQGVKKADGGKPADTKPAEATKPVGASGTTDAGVSAGGDTTAKASPNKEAQVEKNDPGASYTAPQSDPDTSPTTTTMPNGVWVQPAPAESSTPSVADTRPAGGGR
jgi:hypothetical protein